jgi:hypothetical protein
MGVWAIWAAIGLLGVVLAGCVSVHTSGAANADDLQAENRYNAIYFEQMSRIHSDNLAFAPSGTNPGVCNAGGSQQGCFDADTAVINDLQALLDALASAPVPPRFADADRLLRSAVAEDIRALSLRNQAIATHDDAAWAKHKVVLDGAIAGMQAAYQAFPSDNRPQPAP